VTGTSGDLAGQPSVKSVPMSTVHQTAGGLENVFQVLPLLPGAAATDDHDGKLAVRGAGPQHNMIVFDGGPGAQSAGGSAPSRRAFSIPPVAASGRLGWRPGSTRATADGSRR